MAYYTDEDRRILANLRCYGAYTEAGHRDAAIMAEFVNQDGHMRATLTPITLATVGLDWDEVRAIARQTHGVRPNAVSYAESHTMAGNLHSVEREPLEHVTLESRLDWVQNPPNGIEEC